MIVILFHYMKLLAPCQRQPCVTLGIFTVQPMGTSRRSVSQDIPTLFSFYTRYCTGENSFYSYILMNLEACKKTCISERLYYRTKIIKRQKVKYWSRSLFWFALYVLYRLQFEVDYAHSMYSDAQNPKK